MATLNLESCLKRGTLTNNSVALNGLYADLEDIIKNKKYASRGYTTKKEVKKMDDLDVSTVADTEDLNDNDLNVFGVEYYKTLPFSPKKYRDFNVEIFKVLDYNTFINNALFNGWLLSRNNKYAVKACNLPSYYFEAFNIYINKNKLVD